MKKSPFWDGVELWIHGISWEIFIGLFVGIVLARPVPNMVFGHQPTLFDHGLKGFLVYFAAAIVLMLVTSGVARIAMKKAARMIE